MSTTGVCRPVIEPSGRAAGWPAVLAGSSAMAFVGGSVAVSGILVDGLLFTAQAMRYGGAFLLLAIGVRVLGGRGSVRRAAVPVAPGGGQAPGVRLVRPRGTEWLWLLGVVGTGLVLFNVALVEGSRHAEPAVIGVAVAGVPVLLAVAGPLLEGRRPRPRVLAAAVVVTCGAILVDGAGRADAAGILWAAVVLGCEAGFTLLAVPLLARHGPWGVSVHTTWLAALIFLVIGLVAEGPAAVVSLRPQDLAAIAYLAVAVTAVAFVLWYFAVHRLGAGRAGLLTGIAPVAAALSGMLLGGPAPGLPVWAGIGVVAAGLVLGLTGLPADAHWMSRGRTPRGGAR